MNMGLGVTRTLLLSAVAIAVVSGSATAQTKTGTTIGQFLGIEPSASHSAMGGAGVATTGGIAAVYFNPAALGNVRSSAIELSHAFWFADISYDYVAAALPIRGWGTMFASVTALNSGDIAVRTVEQPLGTGEAFNVSNVAVGLGFGRQVTSRFAAGAQINYINETIWHTSQNTFTFNLGTVYRLSESGVKLGSSITNLGTRARFTGRDLAIQFDADPDEFGDNGALPAEQFTDRFPVAILFRVGLSAPKQISEQTRVLFLIDAFHPSDNSESVSVGGEWSWKEMFALRAGYQHLFQEDSELGLTFGAGFSGGVGIDTRFNFDYAWADHDHLSETHRMTLVLSF